MDEQTFELVTQQIQYWVSIMAPIIAYVVAGIFCIREIIKEVKNLRQQVTDNTNSNSQTVAELRSEMKELRQEVRVSNSENVALRKEVKRLTNKIQKIED